MFIVLATILLCISMVLLFKNDKEVMADFRKADDFFYKQQNNIKAFAEDPLIRTINTQRYINIPRWYNKYNTFKYTGKHAVVGGGIKAASNKTFTPYKQTIIDPMDENKNKIALDRTSESRSSKSENLSSLQQPLVDTETT